MKILTKLQKNRATWFLIAICTLFFILRLPSLIEPYWYGDEGIYQVISLALNSGWNLYSDVWDNKPPLLYVTYAIFGGDQFIIRLVSLLFGIASTIIFFFLAQKLLQKTFAAGIATSVFVLLFATPYLEGNIANAENFMLPIILLGGLLIYTYKKPKYTLSGKLDKPLLTTGLFLGIAFLFKIVAIFDFMAFSLFLIITSLPKESFPKNFGMFVRHSLVYLIPLLTGFFVPVLLTFVYFALQGTLIPFIQAAFFGNISYVGYNNNFIIPQGFLIIKFVVFALILTLLFIYRTAFSRPVFFITLWFTFALFSAFFSQRPYTHYLLVILPTFCLLTGLLVSSSHLMTKVRTGLLVIVTASIAINYFHVYGIQKTVEYYHNTVSFLAGHKPVKDYQAFFDPETPRDYELVSFINSHTTSTDQVFLWGDSPQIYYLAKKLPPGRYTVSYHMIQDPNGIAETQAAIDKIQPKFIITLSEAPPLPFRIKAYTGAYGIPGAAIYERTY